jgi:hypothetical protein
MFLNINTDAMTENVASLFQELQIRAEKEQAFM